MYHDKYDEVYNIRELDPDTIAPSMRNAHDPNYTGGGTKLTVIGKPGCFAPGTPVRMFNGEIKCVEDIQIGEQVMGDDGTSRSVLDLCRNVADMYFITPHDGGMVVIVNIDHILTLRSPKGDIIDIPLSKYLLKGKAFQCTYLWWRAEKNVLVPFDVKFSHKGQYYGFTLDGNQRFLLSDSSVVHNTGKTHLITSLIYEKRACFPIGLVMSGTEDSNHHFAKMIPSTFIYNKLDMNVLERFIKRQKIAKSYLQNPWALLLLDDCMDDPKMFNNPLFQGIYKNSRHWNIMYILSMQYCMDIKPVIRTNVDGTFILREPNIRNRKAIWENYAGIIPDFGLFCELMDELTSDYCALYINNRTTSNKLEDCVFWYKAKDVPKDFKLGSKYYWDFHNQRYNDRYVTPFM